MFARIPTCLIPPPIALRHRRALSISALLPTKTEPTGQDNPLDKQNDTVSAPAINCSTGVSSATEALNMRAPSTWVLISLSLATETTDSISSADRALPPH